MVAPSAAPSCTTIAVTATGSAVAKRADTPVLNLTRRATPVKAFEAVRDDGGKQTMLEELQRDFTAASASGNQQSLLKTWYVFHRSWFGEESDPLPLNVTKLMSVAALFKKAGYR